MALLTSSDDGRLSEKTTVNLSARKYKIISPRPGAVYVVYGLTFSRQGFDRFVKESAINFVVRGQLRLGIGIADGIARELEDGRLYSQFLEQTVDAHDGHRMPAPVRLIQFRLWLIPGRQICTPPYGQLVGSNLCQSGGFFKSVNEMRRRLRRSASGMGNFHEDVHNRIGGGNFGQPGTPCLCGGQRWRPGRSGKDATQSYRQDGLAFAL